MTISSSTHSRAKRRRVDSDSTSKGQRVDNSKGTIENLYELYKSQELCDVQLQVGYRVYNTHKLILSIGSNVLKILLTDAKWSDARKPCIRLYEEPECEEVFDEFLEYLYTGNVFMTNTNVLPIQTLADKYNVYDLVQDCRYYMAVNYHAAEPDLKVVSWYQYAMLYEDKRLAATLRQYMVHNLSHVMQSKDFLTMQQEVLEDLLSSRDLVIHSELFLFAGLKRWFCNHRDMLRERALEPRCSHLTAKWLTGPVVEERILVRLMSYVRFPIIKRDCLLLLYSDPLVIQYQNFFLPKLNAALSLYFCPQHKGAFCACGITDAAATPTENSSPSQTVNTDSHRSPSCCRVLFQGVRDWDNAQSAGSMFGEPSASGLVYQPSITNSTQPIPRRDEPSHPTNIGSLLDVPLSSLVSHTLSDLTKENPSYCTPRDYICEDWSNLLFIEHFPGFPRYDSQSFFFCTPKSAVSCSPPRGADRLENLEDNTLLSDNSLLEWQVELYPRGVRFPRAKLIGIPDSFDIEETSQDVVRLAVISKSRHQQPCRVEVIVLAVKCGWFDRTEYVETLIRQTCIFDEQRTVHNIDNVVPYPVLNAGSRYLTDSYILPYSRSTCFKLKVIIKPKN
ncbi:hypothetical protein ACOMHN_017926 [Nucella lapillus]